METRKYLDYEGLKTYNNIIKEKYIKKGMAIPEIEVKAYDEEGNIDIRLAKIPVSKITLENRLYEIKAIYNESKDCSYLLCTPSEISSDGVVQTLVIFNDGMFAYFYLNDEQTYYISRTDEGDLISYSVPQGLYDYINILYEYDADITSTLDNMKEHLSGLVSVLNYDKTSKKSATLDDFDSRITDVDEKADKAIELATGAIKRKIVSSVEEVTEENIIYMIPNSSTGSNVYDEYMLIEGKAEKIGSTDVDLTPYLKKEDAATTYVAKSDVVYATNEEIDNLFSTSVSE